MESIQYIGEHPLPGMLGQLALVIAFVSALVATVAYYFATQRRDAVVEASQWRRMGRVAFLLQGFSVFTVIGVIFYVMINQYYEYQYVQAHVSEDLPMRYIFSAFWEGQEGSFLLWLFWHIILGAVLMGTAKNWESPVMSVLSSVQVILISMILGVYIGFGDDPMRLGSNPLMLLREVTDAPIFSRTDYVDLLEGSGLNPLLQNYWMTIHPPTLFLGFASTVVPFCFAVAGLWIGKHQDWLKPALPWASFSGFILGLGILMGGAWAYEALNFGGYWAWDPVENASLVPWIILVAGVHTALIARSTGQAIRATYIYFILTFLLIVYSTFLTRSGILGETSVHAFTEMGLETQLIGFILVYLLLGAGLLISRWRSIPVPIKEETTGSKEFWMFIGSLVLLFSAILITGSTSLPVYNKIRRIFDPEFMGNVITDPVQHYNKYQLWIGVFIGLLSGFAQFLRWREKDFTQRQKAFWIHTGASALVAAVLTFLVTLWIQISAWQYFLLLFAGLFALVSNVDYAVSFMRQNWKAAGSIISHVGFGLLVVGVMASGLNQRIISKNPFLMEGLTDDEEIKRNNIILIENSPMIMEDYRLVYTDDTLVGNQRTFTIDYQQMNEEGEVKEAFTLYPNILYNREFTKMASSNPSTKHYWNRDIFTHITSLPAEEIDIEARMAKEDSLNYQAVRLDVGETVTLLDTVQLRNLDTTRTDLFKFSLLALNREPVHPEYEPQPGDFGIGAEVKIYFPAEDTAYLAQTALVIREQKLYTYPAQINALNARIRLDPSVVDQYLVPEEELPYQEYQLSEGDQIELAQKRIQFVGFNRNPTHPDYQTEEGDIAVGAILQVKSADGQDFMAEPIFLIRDSRPLNVKDVIEPLGLHIRFVSLDPATGKAKMFIAQREQDGPAKIPFEVAFNSYRTDWLVLQAIEFPGINLVWAGSLLMLGGLLMSAFYRLKTTRG